MQRDFSFERERPSRCVLLNSYNKLCAVNTQHLYDRVVWDNLFGEALAFEGNISTTF